MTAGTLDAAIERVLDRIYDPCSVAAGRPVSIMRLGLVLGWEVEGDRLHVRFCVTFPGCTMAPHFTEAARDALSGLPGIGEVTVEVDTTFLWTEERRGVSHVA